MYDELIKRLRELPHLLFVQLGDNEKIVYEAADAIEELVRKEKFHEFLWNVINPNEMETYLSMYRSGEVPIPGLVLPEPPKEET